MSDRTVYVFYPDTIFESDEAELEHAEEYLEGFFIGDLKSLSWCNCTDKWERLYHEACGKSTDAEWHGLMSFRDYLLGEGFTERTAESFRESDEFSFHLDNYVNDDLAGFFMRDPADGNVVSVWQCLNPKGFIDAVKTIAGGKPGPLVTRTGKLVRSCLAAQLAPATPAPDAFVDHGEWHARNVMDPATGKESEFRPHYPHESWEDHFLSHVDRSSPNTRVTAVEYYTIAN